MKFIYATLVWILLHPLITKAGIAGGELTYTWISDSTYRFYFRLYNICDGTSASNVYSLCCYNSCNPSMNFTLPMSKWTGAVPGGNPNGQPVLNACSSYLTKCQNASSAVPNYEEWVYSTIVTLNARCTAWRFSVIINQRNASNNLNVANFYVETVFNNRDFQGNSSPYYTVKPLTTSCINQPQEYNNGAVDSNKDSLVTETVIPLTSNNCYSTANNISFTSSSPSYSLSNNPFQTNNTYNLNNLSGKMTFTPSMQGANTLAIRTKEYRNGSLIGYVMRDVQLQVLSSCSANPVTLMPAISTFSGGAYNAGTVYSCPGQTLQFCFDIKTNSSGGVLLAADNHSDAIAAANITYYNQKTDSVRGCFTWTPSKADTGYSYLCVSAMDSSCNAPGLTAVKTFTLPIFIYPPVVALKDTSVCPNTLVQLHAFGGGSTSYFWNTLPGGSGVASLSCNNCNNPVAKPGITTSYIAVSNSTSCSASDTITLTTLHSPLFTPLHDTTTCPNTAAPLNLKPTPPAGVIYSYQWTPSYNLSNDKIPNPVAKPTVDTSYTVVISSNASPCLQYDTIKINVLDGYKLYTPDTAICIEEKIQMHATGDTNYSYKWISVSPLALQYTPGDTVINPLIEFQGIGKYVLVLKGKYPGCIDSVSSITVDVQPYPLIDAGDDLSLCQGTTVKLQGGYGPTSYPFVLSWNPPGQLDSPYIPKPTFTPDTVGKYKMVFKGTTSAGCSDSDEMVVTVYSEELLTMLTPDTAICSGDTIQLHLAGSGLRSFAWFPAFNIDSPLSYSPRVSPHTTTTYFAWAADDKSCTDTQSITIFVKPKAILELPDSAFVYPGAPYLMDPLGNCLYFSWTPAHGLSDISIANPYALPDSDLIYHVTGKTEFGCTTIDSIKILLKPDSKIDVPNAFAPKSRYNSVIKPVHMGIVELELFTIYNRWGNKIFETTDINEGWDGTFNGELQPMDVYIYTLEAKTAKGEIVHKQGNITLIR